MGVVGLHLGPTGATAARENDRTAQRIQGVRVGGVVQCALVLSGADRTLYGGELYGVFGVGAGANDGADHSSAGWGALPHGEGHASLVRGAPRACDGVPTADVFAGVQPDRARLALC